MIKYICDFCKKEIEGKEIHMICDCPKIMPRIGSGKRDFSLHMHEKCANQLIGEDAINERHEKCEEAKREAEERRKERESKWLTHGDTAICSACGQWCNQQALTYCANCGAKMRGSEQNA